MRAVPLAAAALFFCGCLYIPGIYGHRKPTVSGRILDTDGRPLEGAIVHAVLIQSTGGGNFHNSPKWNEVITHDRFPTDKDGKFSGRLAYTDPTLSGDRPGRYIARRNRRKRHELGTYQVVSRELFRPLNRLVRERWVR